MNTIFVTGTDTGVGMTLVTALVALNLRASGASVGVFKPFATGCTLEGSVLVSTDAAFLHATVGVKDTLEAISPLRLEEALAPLVAARRAGLSTQDWPQRADNALCALQKKYDFVIVEGVGGIAVPICEVDDEVWTVADLVQAWQIPTLVVARRTVGTLNHTLLTVRAAPNFAGLVFNDAVPVDKSDLAAQTSPNFLAELGYFVCGCVPFLPMQNAAIFQEMAASLRLPEVIRGPADQVLGENETLWH